MCQLKFCSDFPKINIFTGMADFPPTLRIDEGKNYPLEIDSKENQIPGIFSTNF